MDMKVSRINPAKRPVYALVDLLAGDVILFFPFWNTPSMPRCLRENLDARSNFRIVLD